MEIVAIIMHLVNGSVVEASVSATVPKMLCTQVVRQYVVLDEENRKEDPAPNE